MTAATLLVMLKKIIIAIMLLQPLVFTSCGGDEPDVTNPDDTENNGGGTVDSGGDAEDNEGLDIVITGDTSPNYLQFRRINETDFMLDYITYGIRDGHISVIGGDDLMIKTMFDGNVTLFSSITLGGHKYIVKEIGEKAFYNFENLRRIEIPNTVEEIGTGAFLGCTHLEYCKLPNKLRSIPSYCFSCAKLRSLEIPNTVEEIGKNSFTSCNYLTNIKLPDSVTKICERAFYYCQSLSRVVCGKSLTIIESHVFAGCFLLKEIYFFCQYMPDFNEYSFILSPPYDVMNDRMGKHLPLSCYCLPQYYENYIRKVGSGYLFNADKSKNIFVSDKIKTFDPKTLQL